MNTPNRYRFVAAIYPNSRGIAFVLFEGLSARDWMVTPRRGPSKLRHALRRIGVQFERYPLIDALVLQDMSPEGTRRSRRIRELNDAIAEYAETYGIPVFTYSREQVRWCFQQFGLVTKYGIAESIAKHIPELAYQSREETVGSQRIGASHQRPIGNQRTCRRNKTPALPLMRQTSLAGPSAFEGRPHLAGGRRHYRR
jgi:hypothetical protein